MITYQPIIEQKQCLPEKQVKAVTHQAGKCSQVKALPVSKQVKPATYEFVGIAG